MSVVFLQRILRRSGALALGVSAACAVLTAAPAGALGEATKPIWTITTVTTPTNFIPGGPEEAYIITATNTGSAPAEGGSSPITLADVLPTGLKVGPAEVSASDMRTEEALICEVVTVSCKYEGSVLPGDALVMKVSIEAAEGAASPVLNTATVEGGGAASATSTTSTVIGSTSAPFGIEPSSFAMAASTSQAGAHPNLTTTFAFNQGKPDHPSNNVRNIVLDTPPGLVGDPTAVPTCTINEINTAICPQDAAVGVATAGVEFGPGLVIPFSAFVYNVKPYPNEPAALAFIVLGEIPVRLDFSVRSTGDYGLRATATGINDIKSLISTTVSLWGVPGDHNGPGPFSFFDTSSESLVSYGGRGSGLRRPFLRNPTACAASAAPVSLAIESWEVPGFEPSFQTPLAPATGCDRLVFEPSVSVTPESGQAGAPSGYKVDIHVPQNQEPDRLATPDLERAVVSLPPGAVVSPSAANGLAACSDAQFGLHSQAPASCPNASQVGTVRIDTPLLTKPLEGQVFVGAPECAPCTPADAQEGRMVRVFIQAQGVGVSVKVQGTTSVDQATGRLTTTFADNPHLPFEDLVVSLDGGPRAPLANPRSCGVQPGVSAVLTPDSGAAPAVVNSPSIELPGCLSSPFAPAFSAGTSNNQAGAFTPEVVSFSRTDAQDSLGAIVLHTPSGLLGMIANVPRCGDAEAQAGSCAASSQIGTATVAAGPGSEPFSLSGPVYLTGPYHGAPFGLAVVVHALAGPYDLGRVIVRSAIGIDPLTAALTITSDPFPLQLNGIPLQLRAVSVRIDREKFVFNATSCSPMSITGAISSGQGSSAAVSARYQAANCAKLAFKPRFTALTKAKTSKLNGAYLHVHVVAAAGQANIGRVHVSLPVRLPSRLTTLQKACLAATFDANPASCPAASVVGSARAVTPTLQSPLTGPAYLVSHGGAAFPDLVIVLQGEGVTLHLVGNTDIKKGITSNTFKTVPDAPVSTFDLILPQGPHSVLTGFGSLCTKPLLMPTELTGQNGALVTQSTKIAVSGCPRHHAAKHHKKHKG